MNFVDFRKDYIKVLNQVKKYSPKANKELMAVLEVHPELLFDKGINSPKRIRHFFAQMAHESWGFRSLVEHASGRAYEGRRDLGNTQKGDGPRFKGRGIIQLTGRHNYRVYGKLIGLNLEHNPDLAADPMVAIKVAVAYWTEKNLCHLADKDDIRGITKRINGGYNGYKDRVIWLRRINDA